MNTLPLHLLDEILFRLDIKSLAKMRCTNLFMKSYISDDPNSEIGYSFRFRSSVIYTNGFHIFHKPFVSSHVTNLMLVYPRCHIFGSCSGHLLIYMCGFFVVNPLTMMFQLVDHSLSMLLSTIIIDREVDIERAMCVGFARTTKRFIIVCIHETDTKYTFEINDGDTCRFSETTITTNSKSDLAKRMKPVYLEGTLHWLRNDGSIIAFNPEAEQALFIPSIFHQEPATKLFFASDDKINLLTLISGTKETISIYTLIEGTKWGLAKQIKKVLATENELEYSNAVSYDGKHLIVHEKEKGRIHGVPRVYDMEANSWGSILWSTLSTAANDNVEFFKFTPLVSFFEKTKVASEDMNMNIYAFMKLTEKSFIV